MQSEWEMSISHNMIDEEVAAPKRVSSRIQLNNHLNQCRCDLMSHLLNQNAMALLPVGHLVLIPIPLGAVDHDDDDDARHCFHS